jgi:hypothetical protein
MLEPTPPPRCAGRLPKIFFITFGAGSKEIEEAAQRLGKQALHCGFFDEIEVFSESDLPDDVMNLFSPVRFDQIRGFGYWAWKPYLINRKIDSLQDGDVLVYLDAGFEINPSGESRFTYYLDFVARHDVLVFQVPHQYRLWVKPHSSLKIGAQDYFRNQIHAGFIMLKVSDVSRRIISRWYELAFKDSGSALSDWVEEGQSLESGFIEHRHDQAVLSHIIISENLTVMDRDETYHTPWIKGKDYPFLCLRNKTGVSRVSKLLNPWPIVLFRTVKSVYTTLRTFVGRVYLRAGAALMSPFQRY